MQSGTAAAHCIAHGSDGFVLSHYAAVKLFLQMEQLLALALQHLGHGYARPAAHHFGYVVGCHLHAAACRAFAGCVYLLLKGVGLVLQVLQLAVAYLCHALVVALAFGTIGLKLQLLHAFLGLL